MTLKNISDTEGFKFPIRDRKGPDFQRISNFMTVQDGQPCNIEKNY